MRNTYQQANTSLTERAASTENARTRAQQLLQRASVITVNTNSKLTQLESMALTYQNNEKELRDLQSRVDSLNEQINGYVELIQERSEYYRQCTS